MRLKKPLTVGLAVTGTILICIFMRFVGRTNKVSTVQEARQPLVHCGKGAATNPEQVLPEDLKWTRLIKSAIHDPRVAVKLAEDIAARERLLDDEVTVVTAYINIGEFQKGERSTFFTPALYRKWMKIFSRITNPVIAFFDQQSDADYFRNVRSAFPSNNTRIFVIPKQQLWAFNSLKPRISQIYANPDYPKHHPNTVLPDYSCAMHAKYEFMLRSVKENPFQTKYFAWVDIGLFRAIVDNGQHDMHDSDSSNFSLYIPPSFDKDKVGYSRVGTRVKGIPLTFIFHDNIVWVCGCFFVARASVMARWTIEYMKYTDYYLCRDLMNTDQQIIYAMFNLGTPAIHIQDYRPYGDYNPWFSLGYLCKDEGLKHSEVRNKG